MIYWRYNSFSLYICIYEYTDILVQNNDLCQKKKNYVELRILTHI